MIVYWSWLNRVTQKYLNSQSNGSTSILYASHDTSFISRVEFTEMIITPNKYYYSSSCPFSQRTTIVLLEVFSQEELKNFEFIEIDLKNKPVWFLKLNPSGQVPVLQLGKCGMVESLSICEYLLSVPRGHALLPRDPIEYLMSNEP